MQSFGIITFQKDIENHEYFNQIAAYASKINVDCYIFSPEDILPNKETVYGFKYNTEIKQWIKHDFPIPSVLYDRVYYANESELKKYSPIMNWLKSRMDLIFIGYGLPNKMVIYNDLRQHPNIAPYLPETYPLNNSRELFQHLFKYDSLILKPIFGSQGQGIFLLSKNNNKFHLRTIKNGTLLERHWTKSVLRSWIDELTNKYSYLVQPALNLKTFDNEPFDIRVLIQKNEIGKWQLRGIGMRIGKKGSFISNIAGGGKPYFFNDWLLQFPEETRDFIQQELNELTQIIPPYLEEKYHPLFEVGLDISIDQNGAIWLLEVNSKPGRSVILHVCPELADTLNKAPIQFAKFFYESKLEGETKNGKILSNRKN